LVVKQGCMLALLGIAIGLASALALTRLMAGFLYNVSAQDLTTFLLASLLFLVIALLASYVPAWRATKVDPVEALRSS
ncbi:MAG: FtsX-like permease family protein, partial [Candidatus Angelobacter sp.]